MSFDLYVGNLPCHFSKENVEAIFGEFEGVKVLRVISKGEKCYSFASCVDIEQLVSVIEEKNNAIVGGRKIIVRASNRELHDYVSILLEEKNKCTQTLEYEEKELPISQFAQNGTVGSTSRKHFSNSDARDRDSGYSSCSLPLRKSKKVNFKSEHEEEKSSCAIPHHSENISFDNASEIDNSNSQNCARSSGPSSFSYPREYKRKPVYSHLSFDSNDKYSKHDTDDKACEQTTFECLDEFGNLHSLEYDDEFENYTWVSVTNFPLWTTSKDILDLFSDYNPACICMMCNEPRKDKTLTEAIVGFSLQQDADDAILNFDNTLWRNRCLLVTDCADLTVLKELEGLMI